MSKVEPHTECLLWLIVMHWRSLTLQPKSRNQNTGLAIVQTYQMEYHTLNGFKKRTADLRNNVWTEQKGHIQDSRSASSHNDEINK